MGKTKMIIVMRNDLNMRKGKMISQGSHASLKLILDLMYKTNYNGNTVSMFPEKYTTYKYELSFFNDTILDDWLNGIFTKIVVQVNSEEELLEIYKNANEKNLYTSIIEDCGLTKFKGIKTKTCIAILGWSDKVDEITKNLKLL